MYVTQHLLMFDCVMSASVSMVTHSVFCMLSCVLSLKEILMLILLQTKSSLFVHHFVVLCCLLIHMTMLGSDFSYHTVGRDGTLFFLVGQAMAYLLYPLLGWLADVYFTRYKFVLFLYHHDSNHCCHGH